MAQVVNRSGTLTCSFGLAPATLIVLPVNLTTAEGTPMATIMDNVPMVNIPSFGMCMAPANPEVIAATSAAMGTPTPAPCVPVIPAPWAPGSPTVTVGGVPALDSTSMCNCIWGGVIQISFPGTLQSNIA